MFLLPLFAMAFLLLLVRGGSVAGFAHVKLRHPWLAFLGVFGSHAVYKSGLYYGTPLVGRPIWVLSIAAIGCCMYLNRHHRGLPIAALGALSNAVVIMANGGRMPTGTWGYRMFGQMPEWYRQPGIGADAPELVLPFTSSHTHLNFLADVLPPVLPLSYPFSVGDVLLGVGVIWFMASVMLTRAEAAAPVVAQVVTSVPEAPVAAAPMQPPAEVLRPAPAAVAVEAPAPAAPTVTPAPPVLVVHVAVTEASLQAVRLRTERLERGVLGLADAA